MKITLSNKKIVNGKSIHELEGGKFYNINDSNDVFYVDLTQDHGIIRFYTTGMVVVDKNGDGWEGKLFTEVSGISIKIED